MTQSPPPLPTLPPLHPLAEPSASATSESRPRIRFAAIVWGLLFGTASILSLLCLADPGFRRAITGVLPQSGGDLLLLATALGVIVALCVGLVVLRRLQNSRR